MDIEVLINEYENKTIDELIEEQNKCLYTIKPALAELQKHIDQNVNQLFFLMCVLSIIYDREVDEKEFILMKRYINKNVTYDQFKEYAMKIENLDDIEGAVGNMINLVGQFSKPSSEEFIKFMLGFMSCKETITDEERNLLRRLYNLSNI